LEPRREQIASAREATDVAPPAGVTASPLQASAYSLAQSAHRHQRRPTDGRPFLDHVTEVATFLHEAAFDERLVAVGLLHDSVERGSLSTDELRGEMGEEIASFVLALTEDAPIASFEMRKAALRDQVRAGGELAVTAFAADKLSDIIGLRRGEL
jgi:GTP diphosphokinase / guanosine-3',5'-bis(diphosphate) 3'-diphosphatase